MCITIADNCNWWNWLGGMPKTTWLLVMW